jgi:hypothetical protein
VSAADLGQGSTQGLLPAEQRVAVLQCQAWRGHLVDAQCDGGEWYCSRSQRRCVLRLDSKAQCTTNSSCKSGFCGYAGTSTPTATCAAESQPLTALSSSTLTVRLADLASIDHNVIFSFLFSFFFRRFLRAVPRGSPVHGVHGPVLRDFEGCLRPVLAHMPSGHVGAWRPMHLWPGPIQQWPIPSRSSTRMMPRAAGAQPADRHLRVLPASA